MINGGGGVINPHLPPPKKNPWGCFSLFLTNNLPIAAQALMHVVDNQASENIRGDNDSPTDQLLLDNGLEEEEEEEEEGEQLPVHHHEDAVEQEITEGPEPVGDVDEETTDFPGATGMIWE